MFQNNPLSEGVLPQFMGDEIEEKAVDKCDTLFKIETISWIGLIKTTTKATTTWSI